MMDKTTANHLAEQCGLLRIVGGEEGRGVEGIVKPTLPHDICRCHAAGCDKSGHCLRFLARSDLGFATPWTERFCEPGREAAGGIFEDGSCSN